MLTDDPTALLAQLVAIPSITGQEAQIAEFCEAGLAQAGFRVMRQRLTDGRFNLIAERGQSPCLLLYAHLDTVAPAPDWQSDPFELQREGDRLIGLGSSDMKAGLAAILSAALTTRAPLRISLGVDEEAWSAGAWKLLESEAFHGITTILVPELTIDSDSEVLGIGRRGHAGFTLETHGPRRHGAVALEAPSAIAQASRLALALEALPLASDPRFGKENLVLRGIHAQSQDLTVPDRCRLELSWLSLPGRKPEHLTAELAPLLRAHQAELAPWERPTPLPPAYAIDAATASVSWLQTQAEGLLGHALPLAFGLSVADENVLATLGLPVLSLAPVGSASHRAGEWVSATSLARVTSLYQHLIESPRA